MTATYMNSTMGYGPYYWGEAYDSSEAASMGAMASGASLLENVARMCKDLTTETGIEIPLMVPDSQHGNIYSIDGTLLRQGSTDLQGLPTGIYVVNGKKVAKK